MTRGRTPDLLPAMGGFSVIDGGKDDRRPAERIDAPTRRRIGGEDV